MIPNRLTFIDWNVVNIATVEAQGYRWNDVQFVACRHLSAVPDGETIPPGAGPPPQS